MPREMTICRQSLSGQHVTFSYNGGIGVSPDEAMWRWQRVFYNSGFNVGLFAIYPLIHQFHPLHLLLLNLIIDILQFKG